MIAPRFALTCFRPGLLISLILPLTMSKVVCQIVKLRPDRLEEYKEIHSRVWPSVLRTIEKANIVDYTIHFSPQFDLLIARFTYVGTDWEADMTRISEDPDTRRWWELTDDMQQSLVAGATGSAGTKGWWTELEEVFSFDGQRMLQLANGSTIDRK